MGDIVDNHILCKPATLADHRQFTMSTRINNPHEIPKKTYKARKNGGNQAQVVFKSAQKTVDMIELLKKRDSDIAIEEATFA